MQEGVKKVTPQRQDKVGDCPACQAQEPLEAIAPPFAVPQYIHYRGLELTRRMKTRHSQTQGTMQHKMPRAKCKRPLRQMKVLSNCLLP